MKVETYEEISVDEVNGAVVNEAVNEESLVLIESLGLSGQRSLLAERESEGGTTVERMPYRRMTSEERAIYGALMPRRVELSEYSDGPIPLRVLQIASHAKPMFDQLTVWCPGVGEKDPVLVGSKGMSRGRGDFMFGGEDFILARWGDVLEDFDTLREKAKARIATLYRAKVAEAKAMLVTAESSMEAQLDAYLRGIPVQPIYVPSPNFSDTR